MNLDLSNSNQHFGPVRNGPSPDIIEVGKPLDVRALIHLLLEKWRLIFVVGFGAAAVVTGITLLIPTKYQAKAVLQVDQEEVRLVGADTVVPQDLKSPEALNTIVENVKNTSVLRRVVEDNKLSANKDFFTPKKTEKVTEDKLVKKLRSVLAVKLRPETRLVDIMVTHTDGALAQKLATSVAEEFIRQNLYDRFNTSKAANGLLYEEAERLKAKLEKSEQEIQAYKEATQTVSIEDRQNVLTEKWRELTKRFTEAQTHRMAVQAELSQIQSTNPATLLNLPSVQADVAVIDLRKRLVEQEAKVAELKAQYQATYPKVVLAEQQLTQLYGLLQSFAEKVRVSAQTKYQAALAEEQSLATALQQVQAEALTLDKKAVGYSVRVRELQSDRALYDSVLKRLKETDLSKGLGQASLTMVEPANNAIPQGISPVLLIAAAFFMGIFGAASVLYLLRMFRGFVYTVDDVEHGLGLPVWAAIPSVTNGASKELPHIVMDAPGSICAEGFRMLRASASIAPEHSDKKILLFTSADPQEGKTFCSLNYAICQAQEGKRTLLIDLDLRRPSIGENFDLPEDAPGVTDYLVSTTRRLKHVCYATPYPDLCVLPAGQIIANPAEELSNGRLLDLLSEASTDFDRVIIDTAPINAVSDTFLILPYADTVCLVVRSGKTSQRAIKRVMDLMVRANIPPAGIVLNYLPQRRGYGHYYHYGSDYSYRSESEGSSVELLEQHNSIRSESRRKVAVAEQG